MATIKADMINGVIEIEDEGGGSKFIFPKATIQIKNGKRINIHDSNTGNIIASVDFDSMPETDKRGQSSARDLVVFWAQEGEFFFDQKLEPLSTPINPSNAGAWVNRSTGLGAYKRIEVVVQCIAAGQSQTIGVRPTFTTVSNTFVVRRNTSISLLAMTDSNGDIQIFSTSNNVIFTITAIL